MHIPYFTRKLNSAIHPFYIKLRGYKIANVKFLYHIFTSCSSVQKCKSEMCPQRFYAEIDFQRLIKNRRLFSQIFKTFDTFQYRLFLLSNTLMHSTLRKQTFFLSKLFREKIYEQCIKTFSKYHAQYRITGLGCI